MMARSKATRGRPPKKIRPLVYRLTFTLDPVKHAPIIALLEATPEGSRSKTLTDVFMSMVSLSIGGTVGQQPTEVQTLEPDKEIEFSLSDF